MTKDHRGGESGLYDRRIEIGEPVTVNRTGEEGRVATYSVASHVIVYFVELPGHRYCREFQPHEIAPVVNP